jgi:hypothetical protein
MTHAVALLFTVTLPQTPDLAQLEDRGRYFELRDAVAKIRGDDTDTLYFRGITRSRFGDPGGAEKDLLAFVQRNPQAKARAVKALNALAHMEGRRGRYREAVRHIDRALQDFAEGFEAEEKDSAQNVRNLWKSIEDLPPQTVSVAKASSIPMRRTIGFRVPATFGEKEIEMIFDTGANFSCLSATMAQQLGARVRPEVVRVQAISGNHVPARMAELPEFRLGEATVRHAVALVFEDKDVTIPGTTFRLDAILGFPVIAGLRQFSLTRDGKVEIPTRPGPRRGADLCLDGLNPLVQATAFGKPGTYSFDTGADSTDLWPAFFRDHETEIRAKGSEADVRIQGVGEGRTVPAWRVPSLTLTLGGKEVRLNSPRILTQPVTNRSRTLHGNLGQDLVRQFERVTINFEKMCFWLES